MRKGQKSVESEDHPYFCSFFYFRRYFQSGVVGRYYFQRQAEADALTCIVMCVAASIERLEYVLFLPEECRCPDLLFQERGIDLFG